ncbi:MAG TPA: flagellar basal body rod protein FlgB [Alphaproteobacteria bacterium]|nr:flagellar basal body rod protein FlgB [Alphaproteobacteria bacterium]
MNYLSTRQSVIAQNIANADTPEYRPRDLTEVDFGAVLQNVTGSKKVRMERTEPGHMLPGGNIDDAKERKSRLMYEVAPDDNGVIIEEQMIKASQTTMDYNLITNLMRKNVGMIQTALGRPNGQ